MKTQPMMYLDISKFLSDLMSYLTGRRNITWTPTLIYQPLFRICSPENEFLNSIPIVGKAVEIISEVETAFHAEEFEHLVDNLGCSPQDFRSFFTISVDQCFFTNYTGFNFIRYLSYISSFSILCHRNGYVFAPDFAVLAILEVVQRKSLFRQIRNWTDLVVQANRIVDVYFVHPALFSQEIHH